MSRFASSGFTVFVVFFGVAMIDAFRHGEWTMSVVYIGLALLFLRSAWRRSATNPADGAAR